MKWWPVICLGVIQTFPKKNHGSVELGLKWCSNDFAVDREKPCKSVSGMDQLYSQQWPFGCGCGCCRCCRCEWTSFFLYTWLQPGRAEEVLGTGLWNGLIDCFENPGDVFAKDHNRSWWTACSFYLRLFGLKFSVERCLQRHRNEARYID